MAASARVPADRGDAGSRGPGGVAGALYPSYSRAYEPEAVAGRAFSLDRLALYLSVPSISFEFHPASPWPDVRLDRPLVPVGNGEWDEARLQGEFARAVERCIGNARRPAVLFSGGLDSGAVLCYAARHCAATGARLVALLIDMIDDAGVRSSTVALRLLDELDVDCELYSLDAEMMDGWQQPQSAPWSPVGPRIGGIPHLLGRINAVAEEFGCDVLLTGDGSDELLGAPRFIGVPLARHPRTLARYLQDVWSAGRWAALRMEALAALARVMPRHAAARLYWTCLWPELCDLTPTPALADAYRSHVETWSADWLQEILDWHAAEHGSGWHRADAWDACFPVDDDLSHFANGAVPERAPFLDPAFVRYGLGLNSAERYDADLPNEYHRRKAPVISLYPPAQRAVLPTVKQLYGDGLARHERARVRTLERSVALGLVDAERAAGVTNAAVLGRLQAVEDWIRSAEEAGAHGA